MSEPSRPSGGAVGAVVGVDIGGTKTAVVLADASDGRELARGHFSTPYDAGPDAMLARLRSEVDALIARGNPGAQLRAIGVGVPGQVDDRGRVIEAGNLRGWTDLPLAERLRDVFGVPSYVENDGSAGALGERWRGCARDIEDFVFLSLGTGLGAGIVIQGRLHRGAHHAAGEIGSLVPGTSRLGARSQGHHLGEVTGGRAIREQAEQRVGEKLTAAEAIAGASRDERLEPLADRVADHVSLVVLALATVLDPEIIVLGGGTALAGDALLERVRERITPSLMAPLRLVQSTLGADAQVLGALWGAFHRLGAIPEVAALSPSDDKGTV